MICLLSCRQAPAPPLLRTQPAWQAPADGRTAVIVKIELPQQSTQPSDGLTVVYSQTLESRAQKCPIATSRIKRGGPATAGSPSSALADSAAGEFVTRGVVEGAREISGGPKGPIEVPRANRTGWGSSLAGIC